MKLLVGMAGHPFLAEDSGRLKPFVETVLVVSEEGYALDAKNEVVHPKEMETLRFITSPAALRWLATRFVEVADEAEKLMNIPRGPATPNGAEQEPAAKREPTPDASPEPESTPTT